MTADRVISVIRARPVVGIPVIDRALKMVFSMAKLHRNPVSYFRSQGAEIGEGVEIFGASLSTFGSEPYLVSIGNQVTVSHGVDFITHDGGLRVTRAKDPGAYLYGRIRVADHCFIGAHSIFLPGATVGAGSVIGTGSIVAGEIPPGVVAIGVPAKPVKSVDEYVAGKRHLWIDTGGLTYEEKKKLLTSRLPKLSPQRRPLPRSLRPTAVAFMAEDLRYPRLQGR
jgi:acetyltransferase-like isoleucine patch superfamily enzyme